MNYTDNVLENAKKIFEYLYLREEPQKADAVIGFGHFDLKIPRRCAELYLAGLVPKILFTGGVGAGSADFQYPEAIEFKNLVLKEYPQIPEADIIIESKSTNTGENLRFMQQVLLDLNPEFTFGKGIKKVLKVSNAYRQRRAYLTCKKEFPGTEFVNTPACTSFEQEMELYQTKNQDLLRHLSGEMERMLIYPALNYIVADKIPEEILQAYKLLMVFAPKYN
ncbi:MAG TPA: YdcF family protein [Bacteroidales bacterium]|nr:YdcF family protein [Bacteroidales bacterium]